MSLDILASWLLDTWPKAFAVMRLDHFFQMLVCGVIFTFGTSSDFYLRVIQIYIHGGHVIYVQFHNTVDYTYCKYDSLMCLSEFWENEWSSLVKCLSYTFKHPHSTVYMHAHRHSRTHTHTSFPLPPFLASVQALHVRHPSLSLCVWILNVPSSWLLKHL